MQANAPFATKAPDATTPRPPASRSKEGMEEGMTQVTRAKKPPRVGIPRALHFYRFFPFWKRLLEELGCEVVLSQATNKRIVQEGATMGFGELCLPVKVYYGHVLKLVETHPDLDFLFVPRYVSEWTDGYFCPKFLSLPDVIKILPGLPPLLEFTVNVKERPTSLAVVDLARQLGRNERAALKAYRAAKKYHAEYLEFVRSGASVNLALKFVEHDRPFKKPKKKPASELHLLLLGHGYNIFDTHVNLDFQKKLVKQGAEVLTLENMPAAVFQKPVMINGSLRNYWGHEEEILATVRYFLNKGRTEIDGVIFLVSFACGPDSLIAELIMRDMKVVGLPFLYITMDEHTGEAGMLTRIESFVEMIKRKKQREREARARTRPDPGHPNTQTT